jgi:hypothetical protein
LLVSLSIFDGNLVKVITLWEYHLPQDVESKEKFQPSTQGDGDEQTEQINTTVSDATEDDSGSLPATGNDNKKVSREDIELVR